MNRQDAKDAKKRQYTSIAEPGAVIDAWASEVIGAAIEVHRGLGPGFLEIVYEEALAIELELRNIPFARQVPVAVSYKGYQVGEGRVDILVADTLIVELKAIEKLTDIHTAQVSSYLKAMRLPLGLLINCNVPMLKAGLQRIAFTTRD